MARPSVLVVADDDDECAALVDALSRQSTHDVVGPLAAVDALRFCAKAMPAVLVVHVELRDISADEFCHLIRGRANGMRVSSVLFGSSRGPRASTAVERPPADGYISIADLPAATDRVQALARQAAEADERPIAHYRGRHLDARFDRVEVLVDGLRVDLTRRELALLQFLVTHANRVLGRADLLGHVWRNENDGRSRTVDVHIRRLRVKLGTAGTQIQTVPGVGYRFNEG